jgi:hypothetical protein
VRHSRACVERCRRVSRGRLDGELGEAAGGAQRDAVRAGQSDGADGTSQLETAGFGAHIPRTSASRRGQSRAGRTWSSGTATCRDEF